jgi:hypothetical protein
MAGSQLFFLEATVCPAIFALWKGPRLAERNARREREYVAGPPDPSRTPAPSASAMLSRALHLVEVVAFASLVFE